MTDKPRCVASPTPTFAHPMAQYHDLMRRCLEDGEPVKNERTGEICHTLVGEQLKFDMRDGFPAITTKKLAFKTMVGELLGILRGATSAAEFRELGCKVWDGNANETRAWLDNPHRKGLDDIGRSYGAQWTDWTDLRVAASEMDFHDLKQKGFQQVGVDSPDLWQPKAIMRRGINQVEEALHTILANPTDRRIVINGWRPDEHDRTALPVCHMVYTFVPNVQLKRLDLVMHQRSWDTFLAFNIPMTALFLHIMSRLSGYEPGIVTMQVANAHVYESHAPQVTTQLAREHYPQPKLLIADRLQPVSPAQVKDIFQSIEPADFALQGYLHHPALTARMAT